MRTRIISAFPGTGKTFYHEAYPETTLDSDSSAFSWTKISGEKVRNLRFPNNYIQHIKENIGKYEIIFVSSHREVREALLQNCLFFYLLYPNRNEKEMYLQRYKERGSSCEFIELISDNWDNWLKELRFCDVGCKNIEMRQSVADEIWNIISSERGMVGGV